MHGWMATTLILMVVSPAAHAKVTYLALGDSYTSGVGVRPHEAFPEVLVRHWSALGCRVNLHNKARGGRTARGVFHQQLKEIAEIKPDLVSLGVGTNDIRLGVSVEEYLYWVGAILDELVSQGVPAHRIWVFPQPAWHLAPVALRIGSPEVLMQQRNLFNKSLRKLVLSRGMRYLEMGKMMQKQASIGDLSPDLFHPSPRAYAAWAKWVVTNLEDPCLLAGKVPDGFP